MLLFGYPWRKARQRTIEWKVGKDLMPSPRNNKAKTGNTARPAKAKRKIKKSDAAPGTGSEPTETSRPLQSPPEAPALRNPLADRAARLREVDEELVLTFLSYYQALEQALMRAGYIRASHTPGTSQPDWPRFARHIQPRFDPDSSPVLQGAVAYMLWDEDNLDLRNERIEKFQPWENPDPHNDTVWLAELVQQTGRKLIQGLNFPGERWYDMAMVSAALFIVEEWSHLDLEVEKLLVSGL